MIHCRTVEERVHMVSQMLAQPAHGLVSQLSRAHRVSRQTLYRWTATGVRALEEALGRPVMAKKKTASLQILVLTLLIETHASHRGIQSSLRSLHGIEISLGRIASMVKEAGQRAMRWMDQQQAGTARVLDLDEQYSSQRGKAYGLGVAASSHPWSDSQRTVARHCTGLASSRPGSSGCLGASRPSQQCRGKLA